MNAKAAGLMFLFSSGPCSPSSTGSGGAEPPEPPAPIESIRVCPDDFYEGSAWAHSLRVVGDDLETYVTWNGCATDVLRLCWSGEYDPDTVPLTTDLFIDYNGSETYCTEERGRTLRVHAYQLRLDAFYDGHDQIDFWLQSEKASYTW